MPQLSTDFYTHALVYVLTHIYLRKINNINHMFKYVSDKAVKDPSRKAAEYC